MLKSLGRLTLRLLALLGALLIVVTYTPLVDRCATVLATPWSSDSHGDILIVLAGNVLGEGTIGDSSYLRALYAVRAWRDGGFRQIVISGQSFSSNPMREFMISQGVPEAAILLEPLSQSTRENALFSVKMLQNAPGTKVLLTSDYHTLRAWRAFHKAGLDVLTRPVPDARKRATRLRHRWWVFTDLCEEISKIAYYKARGWI